MSEKKPIICLLGPTTSGKTPLAIELAQQLPLDIISVDSAMVYRGMDIGTAKPDKKTLQAVPHRLIDIRDPLESYSAGEFVKDALHEIEASYARGRVPFLVGGTMMYFRLLQQGLAAMPSANMTLREELIRETEKKGLNCLYEILMKIDAQSASRIHPNDAKRIYRALEVYYLSGKTLSAWHAMQTEPMLDYVFHSVVLTLQAREQIHERIARRFALMLKTGFLEEVEKLFARRDLSIQLPSIRSVGYRQAWSYLSGEYDKNTMQEKALAATRQLAKHQLTWLRTWPQAVWFLADHQQAVIEQIQIWLSEV